MRAYVYPSVHMYLSASCVCVCVSRLAFVCVHARVRKGVCVSPSVRPAGRPSVCLSVRVHVHASKCLIVHASVRQCMRDISFSNLQLLTSMFALAMGVCLHKKCRACIDERTH